MSTNVRESRVAAVGLSVLARYGLTIAQCWPLRRAIVRHVERLL